MNFNEVTEKINAILNESVEDENEKAELKAKKRVYDAAIIAIENLRALLEEGIDPSTGAMDPETEEFHTKLGEISGEIYSRSLAFEIVESVESITVKEDLDNAIINASANVGCEEMINILLAVVGRFVPEKTLERIKANFEFELTKEA